MARPKKATVMYVQASAPAVAMRDLIEELQSSGLQATRVTVLELAPAAAAVAKSQLTTEAAALATRDTDVFFQAWHGLFGDRATTATEAIKLAWELQTPAAKQLDLALRELAKSARGPITPKSLGRWMAKHAGENIGGKWCLTRCGFVDHVALWRLRTI